MFYWGMFTQMDARVADMTEENFNHVFSKSLHKYYLHSEA